MAKPARKSVVTLTYELIAADAHKAKKVKAAEEAPPVKKQPVKKGTK